MEKAGRFFSFFAGNRIVSLARTPIGTGVAFAQKYMGEQYANGDGPSNQGQVLEAFNMASLLEWWLRARSLLSALRYLGLILIL